MRRFEDPGAQRGAVRAFEVERLGSGRERIVLYTDEVGDIGLLKSVSKGNAGADAEVAGDLQSARHIGAGERPFAFKNA